MRVLHFFVVSTVFENLPNINHYWLGNRHLPKNCMLFQISNRVFVITIPRRIIQSVYLCRQYPHTAFSIKLTQSLHRKLKWIKFINALKSGARTSTSAWSAPQITKMYIGKFFIASRDAWHHPCKLKCFLLTFCLPPLGTCYVPIDQSWSD